MPIQRLKVEVGSFIELNEEVLKMTISQMESKVA